MTPKRSPQTPLTGRVALVAGATRGAGRGIARALGEAGATVYCTGRSVKGKPSPYGRPETIDETATLIKAAGGAAIAVRVDHTSEREVTALFRRILRTRHRLDVVIDSVAGEWATELAAHGITVLAITPGFLRSEPRCSTSG
jgi:NAD(P)-dependent dehydrogenase (short-subunit alcohol dehydrogenase family)